MKAIQFNNIISGIFLIKSYKKPKVLVRDVCMKLRTWIQSAVKAMCGPTMKLNMVIGISKMKYNFSVAAWLLKLICILQHE